MVDCQLTYDLPADKIHTQTTIFFSASDMQSLWHIHTGSSRCLLKNSMNKFTTPRFRNDPYKSTDSPASHICLNASNQKYKKSGRPRLDS